MAASLEVGRSGSGRRGAQGREWIKASTCGARLTKAPDFFDLYKSPLDDATAGSPAPMERSGADGRLQRRAGSARRTEESLWLARHRGGVARSEGRSVGRPRLRGAEAGHQPPQRRGDAGADGVGSAGGSAERARTLWMPLSEAAGGHQAKPPDPGQSAALLFRRGADWDRQPPAASPGKAHAAGRALGLWQSMLTPP
mmetsp:Transcript_78509/g.233966  ORF Transcript_78509/g.233966 Transcript_78509/m.233966 type:complete len:198 (-) Transcript_78509:27-620(-)|eukprot:CAMPEP_0175257118 /NCGR_PEP_ID=MMETSP0093-20121207/38553_1 /TAXON_ID=311494 /ORGANISM="Alexandrium monilatum, Strain CCMP3105" /LENGTH=197 /DNA_ID=CAMNT_0016551483 /DNA_START=113 /DNA_END=706 /DNA_ORIENTATION=+